MHPWHITGDTQQKHTILEHIIRYHEAKRGELYQQNKELGENHPLTKRWY